ncbi:hypothetical protein L6164_008017 [Bauhinia variegata]|uniref:Uncharacterized protein n=1 Tax=Bauhinia variegata TaxID=167791 RepID=A0ACB9PFB1_BAUVA|nr:hypothetical protein L6164_008017 [Bauhinia variegata]
MNTESKEMGSQNATSDGINMGHLKTVHDEVEARRKLILVQWLNIHLPLLNLPINIKDDDLRACLSNGIVLCHILNKIRPGSVNVVSDSDYSLPSHSENVKRFLAAMDVLGLPRFEISDLQMGSMKAVVDCLLKLRAKSLQNSFRDSISITNLRSSSPRSSSSLVYFSPPSRDHRRKISSSSECNYQHVFSSPIKAESSASLIHHAGHKFHEMFQHGSYADLPAAKISEMMKSNSLENAPTQLLLSIVNGILDESVEKINGEIPHHVSGLLRKVMQEIERRISAQAEHMRTQNYLFKVREEKYQSRITELEALASRTREESEITTSQPQQLKTEKTEVEEKKKADDEDIGKLMKQREDKNMEISMLKQDLETMKKTYELRCSELEAEAKGELRHKSEEYEKMLEDFRNTKALSESKYQNWIVQKNQLQNTVDFQFRSLQQLKVLWGSIKQDIMKEQSIYSEECNKLGLNLKTLADSAEKYHAVLAENRRLFNEVQELKGNIRVYCRIRPFISGQNEKQSIVDHIGEDELVVANPSKQGRDGLRSFKFNKIFGPTATQVDVYNDIKDFIRSVLDGYNVCIFAYGQTGSGKTYTMCGPNGATTESFGVNYRALNDLFGISSSRASSLTYEIWVQMVEIYNEQVHDLLSTDGCPKKLGITNHSQSKGLAVPDASMFPVKSTSDVMELMEIGLKNRAMGATAMNERSSRSHSVVSIHVRGTDLRSGSSLHGNLHLVDLAGSERVDRSEVTGGRLREAQHINKSLSALGDVIFALAQKSSHVPYRNSKLTQLLQSSLGGQAKTLMFVQLNPDATSFSESLSTLKFAERVSGVELGAARSNKEARDVRELMEQVASLKDTILEKDEKIEGPQLLRDLKGVNPEKRAKTSLRRGHTIPKDSSCGSNKHSKADVPQPVDPKHQNDELGKSSDSIEKPKSVSKTTRTVKKQPRSATVSLAKDSAKMSSNIQRSESTNQLKSPASTSRRWQ